MLKRGISELDDDEELLMKVGIIVIAIVAVVVAFVAFRNQNETEIGDVQEEMSETMETTGEYASDQWEDLQNVAFDDKQTFVETIQQDIEDLRDQLAELRESAGDQQNEAIESAKAELNELESQLSEVKNASQEDWENVKTKVAQNYRDAKKAIDDMMQSH